jgi:pimeloyl-ACP methyl ester carboxylesterase
VTPPVRYARSGDVNVAYQVVGNGPRDLIWCMGSYSHLDLLWESPAFARVFEHLAERVRLILFDKRGMGLSDRTNRLYTLEERIDDVRAVQEAVGSTRAHLMGFSEGGAMAVLFAATYPDRVSGLILYGAPMAYGRKADWPYGTTDEEFEKSWVAARERGYADDYDSPYWRRYLGVNHDDPAVLEWWRRLRRAVGSPTERYASSRMNRLIDVRPVLESLHLPVLILVREDDPVAPLEMVRAYAARIPNARLHVLPGQGHLMSDVWEEWSAAVDEFLTGETQALPTKRFLTTLVAADIVGSTDLIARVGDERWRDLLARHYDIVAKRLAMYGGIEVDRAGDGVLARFDGPARAIRFAREIDREDQAIGLRTRAAVHTGEVEMSDGALRGMSVHIASRLTGLANAGEVLVSGTVKDLVGGAGFSFVDRGTHQLKGVPDAKQVFALA